MCARPRGLRSSIGLGGLVYRRAAGMRGVTAHAAFKGKDAAPVVSLGAGGMRRIELMWTGLCALSSRPGLDPQDRQRTMDAQR